MADRLGERDWEDLLGLIEDETCTPFIGAGACVPTLPLGSAIAREWAEEYHYPLADTGDLPRVAQFMAIDRYEMFPKVVIRRQFQGVATPNFRAEAEVHGVLADLPLPIYITTNYDSFMFQALESRRKKPQRDFCRWNDFPQVTGETSVFDAGFKPEPATPLVYHLHGYHEIPQSMVLTESDYLDFLIRLSGDQNLLPPTIRTALAGTSLLFVGYSLADWNFRVLFRGLISSLGASLGFPSIAIQLPPKDLSGQELERAQRYLDQYFDEIQKIKVRIYWGDARAFAQELSEHWEAFCHGN